MNTRHITRSIRVTIGAAIVALVALIMFNAVALAATFTVTPSNQQGWALNPIGSPVYGFETGIDTPPIGSGSFFTDISGGGNIIELFVPNTNPVLGGADLDDLTLFSYSTYYDSSVGTMGTPQQFYVNFYIADVDTPTTIYRLDFAPPSGSITPDTWQTWTINDSTPLFVFSRPADLSGPWVSQPNQTLGDFKLARTNARLSYFGNDALPPIVVNMGDTASSYDGFSGNLDNIRIVYGASDDTYDFEADPVQLEISKLFTPAAIGFEPTTVSFTVRNPTGTDLTNITLEDSFPAVVAIQSGSGVAGTCGGAFTFDTVTNNSFTLSGFDLDAGDSCMFTVVVDGVTAGVGVNNQDNLLQLSADGIPALEVLDFEATVTVVDSTSTNVDFGKTFSNATPTIGTPFSLTIFVFNGTLSPIADANYTDALGTSLTPVGAPTVTNCDGSVGGAVSAAVNASNVLQVSGIDIAAGTICQITIPLVCSQAGVINNITSDLAVVSGTIAGPAAATTTCTEPINPGGGGGNGRQTDWDGDDDEEEPDEPVAITTTDDGLLPSLPQIGEDLIVDIEANPNVVADAGDSVTWTVTVTNNTNSAFDPGQLVTEIDTAFDLISATPSQGTANISGNQILADPGVLQPSVPLTLIIPSTYNGSAALTLPEGSAAQTTPDEGLCGTATIQSESDIDCVVTLPPSLPNTGGGAPPIPVSIWFIAGAVVAVLLTGLGFKLRQRPA